MNISFDKVKEIANRYGIEVITVEEGQGGYIDDETGVLKKSFTDGLFKFFDIENDCTGMSDV